MMRFNRLIAVLLCLTIVSFSYAQQREVVIPPGGLNAIRAAVEADLVANDTTTVEATKYILKRDAIYPYTTQWQPNYFIHLEAEAGEGKRPVMLGVHPASGEAPRFIRVIDGFNFIGLEFAGLDSAGEHTDNAPIRPRGSGSRVWVEDCIFDNQRFEVLRTDATDLRVYMINNIIRNNFQRDRWIKSGGLFFQNGNPIDTIVFRDNTYFNSTCRVFHSINGSPIKYFEMVHNTIVNAGGFREFQEYGGVFATAVLDFGEALNLNVQNNIFYNVGFMGIRKEWEEEHFVFNFLNSENTQSIVISNNNIYSDPALVAGTPDTAAQMRLLSPDLDSLIGEAAFLSNNISEPLTFVNAPMSTNILIDAKKRRWENPETSWIESLTLDNSIDNYAINYAYGMDATSFRAGVGGVPLGSRRWFDESFFVGTKKYTSDPTLLSVATNYPNPFTEATNIHFNLGQAAEISVLVYDMSGKLVYQSAPQQFAAGQNQVLNMEGLNLSAGVYAYQVLAEMSNRRVGVSAMMMAK